MLKPSFTTIVKNYTGLVYFFARKTVANQDMVDDIVSETFMKAFKTYERSIFTTERSLKSWLLTICHNTIRNQSRIKQTVFIDTTELESIPDTQVKSALDQLIEAEELATIKKEVHKLSNLDQQLIHLRIYENISFKDISAIFNASQASIKMRFYRVLQKLKEAIV